MVPIFSKRLYIYVFGAVVGVCLFLMPSTAHAACTTSPAMPYLQTVNNLAVADNLPVGSTIPGSVFYFSLSGQCPSIPPGQVAGSIIVGCYYGTGTEVQPGVYSTGLTNVGIRFRTSGGQAITNAAGTGCNTTGTPVGTLNATLGYNITVSLELVKLGTISSGSLVPLQTDFGLGVYKNNGLGSPNYIGLTGALNVRSITCNTTYPNTVTLPTISASALPASGATAGATPFSISLNCNSAALIGITFDAAAGSTVQSASSGIINNSLTGPSAATNVGLQLMNASVSNPVPMQARNNLGNIIANSTTQYNYAVRYIAQSTSVGPGQISGAITFTFDYQ